MNWGAGHKDFQFSLRFQDGRLSDTQNISPKYQSIQIVVCVASYPNIKMKCGRKNFIKAMENLPFFKFATECIEIFCAFN